MKTRIGLLGLFILVSALSVSDAAACGDKFIVGPAGARVEQSTVASSPARILIYRDIGSDTTSGLRDPGLVSALKEAGHTPVTADGAQGLESAMKGSSFDLVLVDYGSAKKVSDEVMTAASHPKVVPCLNRSSRRYLSEAKKQFNVVMNFPNDVAYVLQTIDKAMSQR